MNNTGIAPDGGGGGTASNSRTTALPTGGV